LIKIAVLVHAQLQADKLFDIEAARDCSLERFVLLRDILQKHQMACRTFDMFSLDEIDFVMFHDLNTEFPLLNNIIQCNPNVRIIYAPNEPYFISPLHDERILANLPFDGVLSWNDKAVKSSDLILKCNIGQPIIDVDLIPSVSYEKKSFTGCIYSNKTSRDKNGLYRERTRAIEFFATKTEGIDLYGIGWENERSSLIQRAYKGKCERKIDVLKRYKFSICYENVRGCAGLITEKIFDCFAAGTVPIYYGAPNIQDYIPSECFIDFRDFSNYESLYDFMLNMSEVEYQAYLDAVKIFIDSPAYQAFTSKGFAETVLGQVQALNNAPVPNRSLWKFKLDVIRAALQYPPRSMKNFLRYVRFLFKFTIAR